MNVTLIFILFVLLVGAGVIVNKRLRRRRALASPFPEAWLAIIRQNLPPYARLT
ncbi:MAG: zinc-dependent peptidase, partial [Desulfuromonadales bacterium]|nr:zinc-dependent peptidase [Desulfuromonadales bacterium]NIS44291.1 zinc-dependent peptidase [Desulfuromonadales bacterium]